MGNGRQELIVNLSGDQKKALGFATWTQVGVSAAGIVAGTGVFTLIKFILTSLTVGAEVAVLIGLFFFTIVITPFLYIAFWPIRDSQGNLLYYMNKQLRINHDFERKEIGTYLNIQTNHQAVNRKLSYAPQIKEGSEEDAAQS